MDVLPGIWYPLFLYQKDQLFPGHSFDDAIPEALYTSCILSHVPSYGPANTLLFYQVCAFDHISIPRGRQFLSRVFNKPFIVLNFEHIASPPGFPKSELSWLLLSHFSPCYG